MALIDLEHVSKDYRRGTGLVRALHGVTLAVEPGEFVAVWGPSGSGKTTLANMIGLLDRATAGRVCFNGHDVASLGDDRRSRLRNQTVGFIFQSFNLLPVLTVLENVALPLEIRGDAPGGARELARRRLDELGLGDRADSPPGLLSGGEQQRVGITRALVTDPAVVVADEPTANLDTDSALSIIALMRQLNRERGTTFILSTHDQRLLDHASRRVRLRDGLIVEDVAGNGE